jgi:hypothetical protein|tara:strand:- start:1168 stop:1431 length:264 start_codon:yes stop_codon:yes gene_type:complete
MKGPVDKLREFMSKFIGPRSQKPFRQVEHQSISSTGDLTGVGKRKRKLKKGLTGDPRVDEKILYGTSKQSIFERPLTVEEEKGNKNT